jgi:hypothetical protein
MALNIDARQLQSRTLRASHAQASYLRYRLKYVEELPWCLCVGDMRANLDKLRAGPKPTDEHCAAKIWGLLQLGYPEEPILEGLELLRKASMSAKRAEEGHVQRSRLTQLHKRGGSGMMVARAQVGQARALFSSTKQETELGKIDARLAALEKKSPKKIGAKQVFTGGLIQLAHRRRQQGGKGSRIRADATQYLVKSHGEKWQSLSDASKAGWEDRAATRRAQEWDKVHEQERQLKRRKTELQLAMQDSAYDGPWLMSRRKCTAEEVAQFNKMWLESRYTHSQVDRAYQQHLEP